MCTDLTVTNLRFSFTRRYISQILFFPLPLLPDSLSLPAPLLAAFARPSSLPAHNLAALCSLLSHTTPPGTALGRSPCKIFCAGCILFLLPLASRAPSLPKPPSQPMRYLPPPSPTSPSQPLPPDPFLHQGDSSGGGNGKKCVRLLRLLDPLPTGCKQQAGSQRRSPVS